MKFKASLNAVPIIQTKGNPDTTFLFTKNQIIFTKSSRGLILDMEDGIITDHSNYKLSYIPDIHRSMRYSITIGRLKDIRLGINWWNEVKLKWIHGMYTTKERLEIWTVIVGAIAALGTIVQLLLLAYKK